MPTILVVDDSAFDRRLAGGLLEKNLRAQVEYACDGAAAMIALGAAQPDLVLTDLQMPNMDGLTLVEKIRRHYPTVPVILMTAHGSEEISLEALRKGAVSYVPKRKLAEDLSTTVSSVLSVSRADYEQQRMLDCLLENEARFQLDNDTSLVAPLVAYMQQGLRRMKLCDESALMHVAVALQEAIVNAIEHGNLEVDSCLRDEATAYDDLVKLRRWEEPYSNRRVHVSVCESRDEAVYTIRDEGPGFDVASLPDPTDPANLERTCGRGLLLIRTFMDEVQHSHGGRQITMRKRRVAAV